MQHNSNLLHPKILSIAAIFGFLGVVAGTFGAHGLQDRLSDQMQQTYEIGVRYHLIHAVAMLALATISGSGIDRGFSFAALLFAIGILVFSGSLYVLALTEAPWVGAITPIGGIAFLAGWTLLAVSALRIRSKAMVCK